MDKRIRALLEDLRVVLYKHKAHIYADNIEGVECSIEFFIRSSYVEAGGFVDHETIEEMLADG